MSNSFASTTSGQQDTIWLEDNKAPQFDKLTKNATTDVCIVGGGIGGISLAYLLQQEGKNIILLEVCTVDRFANASGWTIMLW
jgi:NADH dehydrogenase FAD-containing subunit